ncbi:MAG: nucleotidyltransferase [Omnitrophica WOR_2 bacterium RIFCSPHIGHO2_02_FULL_45_21]|nr:MAG: nucleotidyltransferase [Omnitrophica WOR_2 bacterium RIFCSPHIGHO2_02_FULL_45_21]
MKKINQIKGIIAGHKQELRDRFRVKEIGIFGSYARNEQKEKSDIDLLVEFKEAPGLFEFIDLEEYLAKLLKTRVDLVTKKALKPHIGEYILKEVVYV